MSRFLKPIVYVVLFILFTACIITASITTSLLLGIVLFLIILPLWIIGWFFRLSFSGFGLIFYISLQIFMVGIILAFLFNLIFF